MDLEDMLKRVMDQNDRLIDALTASSPVEILRALNPINPAAPQYAVDTFGTDEPPNSRIVEDPWGDPDIPTEQLLHPTSGWTEPPFSSASPANDQTAEAQP